MKRNKILRIATVLLALVLVSTIGMVGTLARYVYEFDELESARVRAGLFRVVAEGDFEEVVDVTLYDWQTGLEEDAAEMYDDDEYYVQIIVPGSMVGLAGTVEVRNYSEVVVDIDIVDFDLDLLGFDNTDGRLQFAVAEDALEAVDVATVWYDTFEDLLDNEDLDDILAVVDGDYIAVTADGVRLPAIDGWAEIELNVFVRWVFGVYDVNDGWCEDVDDDDTAIGEAQADALLADADLCADCEDDFDPDCLDGCVQANTFVSDETDHSFGFVLTLRAVQVDAL